MEFLKVFWYDAILILTVLVSIADLVFDRLKLTALRYLFAALTVLGDLALVICMLIIGGDLTDLLIVLMTVTLVAVSLGMIDRALDLRKEKREEAKEYDL